MLVETKGCRCVARKDLNSANERPCSDKSKDTTRQLVRAGVLGVKVWCASVVLLTADHSRVLSRAQKAGWPAVPASPWPARNLAPYRLKRRAPNSAPGLAIVGQPAKSTRRFKVFPNGQFVQVNINTPLPGPRLPHRRSTYYRRPNRRPKQSQNITNRIPVASFSTHAGSTAETASLFASPLFLYSMVSVFLSSFSTLSP